MAILLSGTAPGVWLAEHTVLAVAVLVALFALALAGAWRRLSSPATASTGQAGSAGRMVEDG